MRTAAIQQQLDEAIASLKEAEERQRAATNELVDNPADLEVRNKLRQLTAYARELCEDRDALAMALEHAKKEDSSDAARHRRQRQRDLVKESILASHARVKKAAAVDKAIEQLTIAMQELVDSCEKSVSTAMDYLAIAHSGNTIRHGDHVLVFKSEARGESYIAPAIGRALGFALRGLELPNVALRDWLQVTQGPVPGAVEEAAAKCAERYAPRIAHHLEQFVGLKEADNE